MVSHVDLKAPATRPYWLGLLGFGAAASGFALILWNVALGVFGVGLMLFAGGVLIEGGDAERFAAYHRTRKALGFIMVAAGAGLFVSGLSRLLF